ncbi:hypothetical protein Bca101_039210 [Brassica carinata]
MVVIILLLPHVTLSATSTYSRPDKFYVNCGSDSNVTYGNQTFVGDMISGDNSVSFTREGTEVINQSGSSPAPEIYRTARIFRRPSHYKFQLNSVGLHFLRLHFSAGSSRTELSTARFTVSATYGSNHPLRSFSLQNFNETPRVEEFHRRKSLTTSRGRNSLLLTSAHFFDIKNNESQPSDFYLYVNGHWRLHVNPFDHHGLVTPFYIDVINVSDGSGLLNVSLGNTEPYKDAGFLNGLEVMEFLEDSSKGSSYRLLIGKSGFGDVYKGILPDESKVAIKRGKTGSGQGMLEFQREIQVLSRIWHRHLVSLTGYCDENSEMILVYEFIEKGTLQEHLYGSDLPSLSWKQRLEICIGAARGLHYLHSGSEEAIIHRDVKSTNILLDENTVAKVVDFGISKLVVRNQEPISISTNIKGTYVYLDPEYMYTHILTEKSDVYSFGVVLLEVLCARPALDRHLPAEQQNLADWAMSCKSNGVVDKIVDQRLVGQIEPKILRKFMEVAEKCLKDNGDERPSMANVSWELEYIMRLQMMTILEDSVACCGGDGSLVIPRLMVSDSFSCNSIVQEDQVKKYGSTNSSHSQTRVLSQVIEGMVPP